MNAKISVFAICVEAIICSNMVCLTVPLKTKEILQFQPH